MRTKEALLNHSGMNEQLLLGSCVCVCLISVDRYDGTLVSGNKEYLGKKWTSMFLHSMKAASTKENSHSLQTGA